MKSGECNYQRLKLVCVTLYPFRLSYQAKKAYVGLHYCVLYS